jgi:hypothetical protein
LAEIACKYAIPVLISNCVGDCEDFVAAGKTSAFNNNGLLLAQLNEINEGLLFFDTCTQQTNTITV